MIKNSYNTARTKNPNYLVRLYCPGQGVEIIADMPEETGTSLGSEWESWMAANGNKMQDIAQLVTGSNLRWQEASKQAWSNSSPVEIPLELIFEAEKDARSEVYEPMRVLEMLALPSTGIGGLLQAPGPAGLISTGPSLEVSLFIGKTLEIPQGIIVSVSSTFSSRLTKEGYPISGRSSISYRTSFTPTRADWALWTKTTLPTP